MVKSGQKLLGFLFVLPGGLKVVRSGLFGLSSSLILHSLNMGLNLAGYGVLLVLRQRHLLRITPNRHLKNLRRQIHPPLLPNLPLLLLKQRFFFLNPLKVLLLLFGVLFYFLSDFLL